MGKHDPMTPKAIAKKIKAKGLQKIKFYCQICEKQCRDHNGFKCHIQSEAHQRKALIVGENPQMFVNEFSKEFMDGFLRILRVRFRTNKILANTVFQEYIKDKDHIHMNGTRWTSLTEFAYWLKEKGIVQAEDSERGVLITYIDPLDKKKSNTFKPTSQISYNEPPRLNLAVEQPKTNPEVLSPPLQQPSPPPPPPPPEEESISTTSADVQESEPTVDISAVSIKPVSIKPTLATRYKPPPPKRLVKKRLKT